MCGICGVVWKPGSGVEQKWPVEQAINEAVKFMHPRGPNGSGVLKGDFFCLGHVRLAVLDPDAGQQPYTDVPGYACVYNGEIYNFHQVQQELRETAFSTRCDTETLVKAYAENKDQCLQSFNGMFAFGIVDITEQALFLARDRLGVKPLFFVNLGDCIGFASSLSALLICMGRALPREFDPAVISHYLTTGRCTLGTKSMIKNVFSLAPGTWLQYHAQEGRVRRQAYWQRPILSADEKKHVAFDDAVSQVSDLVEDAVRLRMISDVPLGGFISGGLDSAAITTVASRERSQPLPLFCAGTDDPDANEFRYARLVSEKLNTAYHEVVVDASVFGRIWADLVQFKGVPLSTPNEASIFCLANALREHCTVTLTGEGADELFGGYVQPQFGAYDYERAGKGPDQAPSSEQLAWALSMRFGRSFFYNDVDHLFMTNSWVPMAEKERLLKPDFWEVLDEDDEVFTFYEDFFERIEACSAFDRRMHLFAAFNLENLLLRIDSSTMFASVEARVPLTDYRLAEMLFQMPDHYKMAWRSQKAAAKGADLPVDEIDKQNLLETKRLLRTAFSKRLPEEVVKRRKMSFPIPFKEWMTGDMLPVIRELCLESDFASQVFQSDVVQTMLKRGDRNLWLLANLAQWWTQIQRLPLL